MRLTIGPDSRPRTCCWLGVAGSIELMFLRETDPPKRKGPYRSVRFEGELIRAEAGGPILARHERHAWHVDGEPYARLQCNGSIMVHFERVDGSRSTRYGPYESVSFIDGVAYVDHRIFAFVDRSVVDWYCHEDDKHWPLMIVGAAQ